MTKRTGVSSVVISRLERNLASPELETLYRVAKCFDMNSTDLVQLAEPRTTEQQIETFHQSDIFRFRTVTYGNMWVLYGKADLGGQISKPRIHHDQYELC